MRKVVLRTLGIWLLLMVAGAVVVLAISLKQTNSPEVLLARSVGTFAAILCFFIARASVAGEARTLTFLYSIFFSAQALFFLTGLLGTIQLVDARDVFHIVQYENLVHSAFLLLVCTYVLGGALLPNGRAPIKMILAIMVVAALVGPSLVRLVINPDHVYTLPEITDFRAIDRAMVQLKAEGVVEPTAEDVSSRVSLSHWQGSTRISELDTEKEKARIAELLPYLEGDNYVALLNRPLYHQYALWATAAIAFLIAFFVVNYFRDLPKPAHFEKIQFTLLTYCVFECFHAASLMGAMSIEEFDALDNIGKYLTAGVLFVFVALFLARLNFLGKSVGMFYEERLNVNPNGVSRWRDSVDRFLLRQFVARPETRNKFVTQRPRE